MMYSFLTWIHNNIKKIIIHTHITHYTFVHMASMNMKCWKCWKCLKFIQMINNKIRSRKKKELLPAHTYRAHNVHEVHNVRLTHSSKEISNTLHFWLFFSFLLLPGELCTMLETWYSAKIRYFLVRGRRQKASGKRKKGKKNAFKAEKVRSGFLVHSLVVKQIFNRVNWRTWWWWWFSHSLFSLSLALSFSFSHDKFNMANSFEDMYKFIYVSTIFNLVFVIIPQEIWNRIAGKAICIFRFEQGAEQLNFQEMKWNEMHSPKPDACKVIEKAFYLC